MKKSIIALTTAGALLLPSVASASTTYTVQKGDSLWKIASKYQVGVSELIQANPQFKNPNLIYPNQKVNIPEVNESTQNAVISLVNQERAKQGLPALKRNWELQRVAQYKAEDMTDKKYFSHNSPTYGTPFQMMKNFGVRYSYAGENIAQGQRTPQEVMNGWMNSSGHRANILSSNFTEIGVGYDSRTNTWVQMFIKP